MHSPLDLSGLEASMKGPYLWDSRLTSRPDLPSQRGTRPMWQDTAVYHMRRSGRSGRTPDRPSTTSHECRRAFLRSVVHPFRPTLVNDRLPHSSRGLNGRRIHVEECHQVKVQMIVLISVSSADWTCRCSGRVVEGNWIGHGVVQVSMDCAGRRWEEPSGMEHFGSSVVPPACRSLRHRGRSVGVRSPWRVVAGRFPWTVMRVEVSQNGR